VTVDDERLTQLEAMRAAEAARANEARWEEAKRRTLADFACRKWEKADRECRSPSTRAWIFGTIGLDMAALFGVALPYEKWRDPGYELGRSDWVGATLAGYVPLVVTLPLAVHYGRRATQARRNMPEKPDCGR